MPSVHIDYNRTATGGSMIARFIGNLQNAAKEGPELANKLNAFGDDLAELSVWSGIPIEIVEAARNMLLQANGEISTTASTAIPAGSSTGCRQLLNAMG